MYVRVILIFTSKCTYQFSSNLGPKQFYVRRMFPNGYAYVCNINEMQLCDSCIITKQQIVLAFLTMTRNDINKIHYAQIDPLRNSHSLNNLSFDITFFQMLKLIHCSQPK